MLLISWLNIIYHKSLCTIGKCISTFYLEGVKLRSKQLRTFYFRIRINYDSSYSNSNLKILKPRKIKLTNSGASGKKSACQCKRCTRPKRQRFNPCDGKIPWSKKWQPTPVFLPGKFQGQKSLVGYSSWGHKQLDTTQPTHHCHEAQEIQSEDLGASSTHSTYSHDLGPVTLLP